MLALLRYLLSRKHGAGREAQIYLARASRKKTTRKNNEPEHKSSGNTSIHVSRLRSAIIGTRCVPGRKCVVLHFVCFFSNHYVVWSAEVRLYRFFYEILYRNRKVSENIKAEQALYAKLRKLAAADMAARQMTTSRRSGRQKTSVWTKGDRTDVRRSASSEHTRSVSERREKDCAGHSIL